MAILAHSAGLRLIYLTAFVTGAGSALRDTAAAAAGIRAPMLAGALPLLAVTVLLAWRHRGRPPAPAS